MASRDHLVPTLTVDKNGRTTTVHKKLATTGSAKSIPFSKNTELIVRRKDLIHGLATVMESTWAGGNVNALTQTLKMFPDSLLQRLDHTQATNSVAFARIVRIAITKGAGEKSVREYLFFLDDLDASSYYAARDHIAALHRYTQLPESDDFSQESDELKSQCRALIAVQRACSHLDEDDMFRLESGMFVLDDDGFVELILAHPDKATQIVNFIRERRSIDVGLIAEVISGDATALGSGTL